MRVAVLELKFNLRLCVDVISLKKSPHTPTKHIPKANLQAKLVSPSTRTTNMCVRIEAAMLIFIDDIVVTNHRQIRNPS